MVKVVVAHNHVSSDLRPIYMAVTRREPTQSDWKPALRDTVNGQLVVWARFETAPARGQEVWVRDGFGDRKVRPIAV